MNADAIHGSQPPAATEPRVAIVGGGIMGLCVAYALTKQGILCDVFEASPVVGGLAGPLTLPDGVEVDRYYHAILSSDEFLRTLCDELGVSQHLRFAETKSAFFLGDGLHSMNSLVEFLRFKPLSLVGRVRLGMTIAFAQLYRDWQKLETVDVRSWLTKLGGRRLFERLWGPMLTAKFDGLPTDIPATWMWSRLVRMKSTRAGANQREQAGHLVGGYATLLTAMAARVEAAGGSVRVSTPIDRVAIERGQAIGVVVGGVLHRYAAVVATMQGPVAAKLIPEADAAYRTRLTDVPYLGIVCPLLVLDRPLSGTWVVNIADTTVPFTGIIETTSYIDPALVGGHHLVYVPKYTAPGSRWLTASNEDIERTWMEALGRIVPGFKASSVRHFLVHRERFVEPLHRIGSPAPPDVVTPVSAFYLATTAQIYPALTNGESVTRHAAAVADVVAERTRRMAGSAVAALASPSMEFVG